MNQTVEQEKNINLLEDDEFVFCDYCEEEVPTEEAFHWTLGTYCDPCAGALS